MFVSVMIMMIMVMMIVVVMPMVMMIMLRMAFRGISAAFRLEGGLDGAQLGTHTLQRGLKTLIGPNAQRRPGDFDRNMAVANMPGQPRQNPRVSGTDLDEPFGRGHHFDQPAILKFKRIAAAQMQRLRQIKQKLQSADAHHMQTPLVPVLEIQQHAVSRLARPMPSSLHFGGARRMEMVIGHGEAPKKRAAPGGAMRSVLNSGLPAPAQLDLARIEICMMPLWRGSRFERMRVLRYAPGGLALLATSMDCMIWSEMSLRPAGECGRNKVLVLSFSPMALSVSKY